MIAALIAVGIVALGGVLWWLNGFARRPAAAPRDDRFLFSPEEILAARNPEFVKAAAKAYTHGHGPESGDLMMSLLQYSYDGEPYEDVRMIAAKELEDYTAEHFRDPTHVAECLQALRVELDRVPRTKLYHSDLAIATERLVQLMQEHLAALTERPYATLEEAEYSISLIDRSLEICDADPSEEATPDALPEVQHLYQTQSRLQGVVDRFLQG